MNSKVSSATFSDLRSRKNTGPKRLDGGGPYPYNAAAIWTGDGSYVQIEGSAPPCTVPMACVGAGPVPFAMSDVLVRSYRLVVRVVLLQAGCAALVASVFLVFKGAHQALAALVGGLIVAAGSAVFGWRLFKPGIAGGATLTGAMYAGVALKWLWFAIALYLAIARLKLDAAPLLIGVVVAQLGYWAGLIRLK
jgi:F0F1-type ATP synthase assembly protein I